MVPSCLPKFLHAILNRHIQSSLETLSAPVWFGTLGVLPPAAGISQTIDSHLSEQWAPLDDILSDTSMFPSIRVVAFPVHYHSLGDLYRGKKPEGALIEEIIRTLQASRSRQLLGPLSKTAQRLQGIDITASDDYSEEVAFFG